MIAHLPVLEGRRNIFQRSRPFFLSHDPSPLNYFRLKMPVNSNRPPFGIPSQLQCLAHSPSSHLPRGMLFQQVTDLDLTVLKGIATSLMSSLNSSDAATAPTRAGATSGSLHYALDKTQRRMIASLRQAFRRADINGDGTLDREEVEGLLRDHLEGNNLDVTQKEAEIVQFIS